MVATKEHGPPVLIEPTDETGGNPKHHVAVVGSRNYPHTQLEWQAMSEDQREEAKRVGKALVEAAVQAFPLDWVVVSGGARGPDTWALDAAVERGMETIVYLPDYDRYKGGATFKRNLRVVSKADEVLAFWDLSSRGTGHTLKIANKQRKKVYVIGPDGTLASPEIS